MSFKVPSIEEIVLSTQRDLIEKEKRLKYLENNPNQIYIWNECSFLKRDINTLKEILSRYKITIREEKLKELGI